MGLREALRTVDDALDRVERRGIAATMAFMGVLVFLDVTHRTATRPEGPLARLAGALAGGFAEGEEARARLAEVGGSILALALGGLIAGLAARTRGSSPRRALAVGAGAAVALGVALTVFLRGLPNGIIWSQTLSLAVMLWLGFAGASRAAREHRHLALDVGSKVWPEGKAHLAAALGNLLTAAFCAFLLLLSVLSVGASYRDWQETGHAGATLVGLPVPKWAAFLSLPYGFSALTFRFGLNAWDAFRGQVAHEESEVDLALRQLGMTADGPKAGAAP